MQGPDGQVVGWEIEAGAPKTLIWRGWRKDSLPPGMTITIVGYRAKNKQGEWKGSNLARLAGAVCGLTGTGAPSDEPKR